MVNKSDGGEKVKVEMTAEMTCEDCGAKLIHEGGCPWCPRCGWSKCG